ncbi:Deleted in malignant brain tumors 1 protein [Holothuria leucospilota]|uniref:Deleted in malignant brain tumors 1 protein n=1 Tax=Holothuria leucospilota TaxID=206669 RepID=A0A9Q1BAQ5_HOLLE|nr:Deleted in malignant brain tumors 1 protein [Holothuria leucospilota]
MMEAVSLDTGNVMVWRSVMEEKMNYGVTEQDSTQIRIVGNNEREGRVEVYHNGQWGTVCDDSWDDDDATVVCRQLGLGESGTAVCCASFGAGEGPIWLDDVRCTGSESNIGSCGNNGWGIEDCGHLEDAGVRCWTETPFCGTVPFNDFLRRRNYTCTAPSAYIASANYPLPYEQNRDWFWHITTSPSTYIEVKFEEFDIESSTKDCEEDYLEFQMRSFILRVCNSRNNFFNSSFLSDQNNLTVKLHSGRFSFGGRFLAIYWERKFVQNVAVQQNVTCRVQNGRRHCYCLFNYHQALTWQNASQGCKNCGDGGYLAVIQSQQDMDTLQQFILQEGDAYQSAYIGLKWNEDSQRFVLVSQASLHLFTDWKVSR